MSCNPVSRREFLLRSARRSAALALSSPLFCSLYCEASGRIKTSWPTNAKATGSGPSTSTADSAPNPAPDSGAGIPSQGDSVYISNVDPFLPMAPEQFSKLKWGGDEDDFPHHVLWDPDGFLRDAGGVPAPTRFVEVVIVGGGMSALAAADALPHHEILLLESSRNLGGNSRALSLRTESQPSEAQVASMGAAYFCKPTPGTPMHQFLEGLGVLKEAKEVGEDYVIDQTGARPSFNSNDLTQSLGSSSLVKQSQLWEESPANQRLFAELKRIGETEFPTIPLVTQPESGTMAREKIMELDQMSFAQWIDKNFPDVSPRLAEYLELYCWSSFGATADMLSAAQALNFICGEFSGILVLPGGNAAIARKLLERLKKRVRQTNPQNLDPPSPSTNNPSKDGLQIQTSALVFKIRRAAAGSPSNFSIEPERDPDEHPLEVIFVNANHRIQCVRAKQVIYAGAKSFARTVIEGIPAQQRRAMEKIGSVPYIVANAALKNSLSGDRAIGPAGAEFYDAFLLKGLPDALKQPDSRRILQTRGFADVIACGYAQESAASLLTIYRPLPYSGARQFLFNPSSYEKHRSLLDQELQSTLQSIGQRPEIEALHMVKWGHAICVAAPRLIAEGTVEQAHQSLFDSRLHFCGQDNWANPSFECAVESAWVAAKAVKNALDSRIPTPLV